MKASVVTPLFISVLTFLIVAFGADFISQRSIPDIIAAQNYSDTEIALIIENFSSTVSLLTTIALGLFFSCGILFTKKIDRGQIAIPLLFYVFSLCLALSIVCAYLARVSALHISLEKIQNLQLLKNIIWHQGILLLIAFSMGMGLLLLFHEAGKEGP
jgi:hypothetical protein